MMMMMMMMMNDDDDDDDGDADGVDEVVYGGNTAILISYHLRI